MLFRRGVVIVDPPILRIHPCAHRVFEFPFPFLFLLFFFLSSITIDVFCISERFNRKLRIRESSFSTTPLRLECSPIRDTEFLERQRILNYNYLVRWPASSRKTRGWKRRRLRRVQPRACVSDSPPHCHGGAFSETHLLSF